MSASRTEIAQLLGLSVRSIDRLADEGVLTKDADGRFDVAVCVPSYCRHLRTGGPAIEARRHLLDALTAERRLKMRTALGRMATAAELDALVQAMFIEFLAPWRFLASRLYYGLVGASDLATVAAGELESTAIAWLAEARGHAADKTRSLLAGLLDETRIDALVRRLDEEVAASGEEIRQKGPAHRAAVIAAQEREST